MARFQIRPIARYVGPCASVKRPKVCPPPLSLSQSVLTHTPHQEFTCFSYDDNHQYRQDDSSIRWYYPPQYMGIDLSRGVDSFIRHDDSVDEHLVGLLRAVQHYESEYAEGKPIDAHIVTWRGMMTKVGVLVVDEERG